MRWANPDGLREAGSFSEVPLAFLILEGVSLEQLFHLWYVANSSCFFPCVHCDTSLVRQTPLKPNALTPCAGRGLRLRRPTPPPPPPVPSKASESARISPFMTTVEEKERRRRRKRTCFSSFHPQIEQSVAVASAPKVRMYAFLSSLSFFRSDAGGGGGGGGGIFRFDLGSEARHLGTEVRSEEANNNISIPTNDSPPLTKREES